MKFLIMVLIVLLLVTGIFLFNYKDDKVSIIVVPVKVHIVEDSSGYYTSLRSEENIIELFNEVNRIWGQAGIYFQIENMVKTKVSFDAIPNAINSNVDELWEHENFDRNAINVFFTKSLNNINGLSLIPSGAILVADRTTVNDYRTTAHELGHILGLEHVSDSNRLMARGKNGELLDIDEINIVRGNAVRFS